ncbi:MAG TPA: PAS domain S-box protein [Burkholderiaceae bacterium]|nr:PAS domain S-box protein [Burkholderiaceae bacterium]
METKRANTDTPVPTASGVPAPPPAARAANDTAFDQLIEIVRGATGLDVGEDREARLKRRIEQRRRLLGLESDQAYLEHLKSHPGEARALERMVVASCSPPLGDGAAGSVADAADRGPHAASAAEVARLCKELERSREHARALVRSLERSNSALLTTHRELKASERTLKSFKERLQSANDQQHGDRAGALITFSDVSELEAAEQALRDRERQHARDAQLTQLVMDSVPALVSYIDDQGVYRWVNKHYLDWFPEDRDHIVGRSIREVVGETIWREVGPLVTRALAGETVKSTRRAMRPHWDSPRWVQVAYIPDRDDDGLVRGVVAIVRDITAEREATQALRARELHANLIFETAPLAMLVVDERGAIERMNRRAVALFGPSAEALSGKQVELVLPLLTDVGKGRQPGLMLDGSTFDAEVSLAPMQTGRTSSTIVTVQDVTLQVIAQRVLEQHQSDLERQVGERTAAALQAEAQMRLIIESTADGLYGLDAEGRITFINASACSMLGYDAAELVGAPAERLLPAAHGGPSPSAAVAAVATVLATGEPVQEDHVQYVQRDGGRITVMHALRAMRREGRIVGAVGSFTDISARLAAEAARETALAEAERLARLRTEFVTNMSHEIRTPLNAVLGLAEIAARGDRDRQPEETFRMILDSGQVLLGVVNDMLDFSKIEAGKLRTESQPFELGPVIDRAVSLVAPRAFAKCLDFSVEEAPGLPYRLRGDALRLTQVLANLLSNALKFTERGSIVVRAWAEGRYLCLSVCDTGIGIAQEQLARLFKPFEQADSSTTRRYGGTGLGLVISRHLMELMGGAIEVQSQPNAGSTFTLRLPLIEAESARPSARECRIVMACVGEPVHAIRALEGEGHQVGITPAAKAFAEPSDLVVLGIDALRDEPLRDEAVQASHRGQRIALLTHPVAAELPPALRGRVTLIEQPLRARHVAACLAEPEKHEATSDAPGGRLAQISLLAAEDNEVNALVLEAILRLEGAKLTLVGNGALAVEQLAQHGRGAFDIVITDIQMPEMDGYEATRRMLAIDPDLPVVGLTAHAMPEERERCLAAGMVDHLAKPVEVEQLVRVVLRHRRRQACC